jgi:hypothetical protein
LAVSRQFFLRQRAPERGDHRIVPAEEPQPDLLAVCQNPDGDQLGVDRVIDEERCVPAVADHGPCV